MKWVTPGEENPCRSVEELDYDELCDGIRETVRRLVADGFRTSQSTDGTFHRELTPIDGQHRSPGPFVYIEDEPGADIMDTCEKLIVWVEKNVKPEAYGTDFEWEGDVLLGFTPIEGVCVRAEIGPWGSHPTIILEGIADKDLKPI